MLQIYKMLKIDILDGEKIDILDGEILKKDESKEKD